MAIVLFLAFGAVTAFLAKRKGYSPYIWFFAAGIIGLIVLAFLPFTDSEALSDDRKSAAKKKGNMIGGVIVFVVFSVAALNFILVRSRMVELKSDAEKALCSANLGKIRIALSNYYGRKSMTASSGQDNPFPASLRDGEFLQSTDLEGGKLPAHPCGRDWNEFYNPKDGSLDMRAACACE